MIIGVFDSGIGGLSVAQAIEAAFPEHIVVFKNDSEHMPYGNRQPQEILTLATPIFDALVAESCDVIVVACNTVSTTLLEQLREQFDIPLIGVEPLIKLAAEMTKTDIIAVCATPTTLASSHYKSLKDTYGALLTIIEPDCSDWSLLIQQNEMQDKRIASDLLPALERGADIIVLGCTHYHWIEAEIAQLCNGRATVIQPEPFVLEELTQVLEQL